MDRVLPINQAEIRVLRKYERKNSPSIDAKTYERAVKLCNEVRLEIHEAADCTEMRTVAGSGSLVFKSFAKYVQ